MTGQQVTGVFVGTSGAYFQEEVQIEVISSHIKYISSFGFLVWRKVANGMEAYLTEIIISDIAK